MRVVRVRFAQRDCKGDGEHVTQDCNEVSSGGDDSALRAADREGADATSSSTGTSSSSVWSGHQPGKCQEGGRTGDSGSGKESLDHGGGDRRYQWEPGLLRENGQHAIRKRECGGR